ncbi:head maturation protease, ClpP-related [Clostridium thermosuccinogenes]|uniref:head maturation protease, ClpP-related n=1 Tax=Clostridium thermosuccinogenes TaxID=84032 RepID=UPI000CCC3A6F|nr:head maturation protease, ClpP-related [Pseudoclostridium thermosuccinogenes]PNT91282.1 hypothetical protein CDQ83_15885 [Pseudoclostridium thermosuccinogenes]
MAKFWNFIKNENNDDEIELRIEGDIIDDDYAWLYEWFDIPATSPNAFREELSQYKGKNITVWIDSYGGSVFAAAGIYNALMEHKKTGAKVTAKVDGKAMSAATIPFMAGDERLMSPMAIFMIHNPLTSASGYASDLRKAADVLDEVKETIINAYQLGTGRSRAKISSMMDDETYMSARTAIKEGFATGMLYTDTNEDLEDKPEDKVFNFTFNRLAIQNAAGDSIKKFFELAKKQSNSQPPAHGPQKADENIKDKEGDTPMYKTVDELKNACPDLVKQIEDAAREEGRKEERIRIQDIEKISKNISPELVNKAKFEEPMDAKELAFKALQADNIRGQEYLANAKMDSQNSGVDGVNPDPQKVNNKKEEQDKAAEDIAAAANKRRGIK